MEKNEGRVHCPPWRQRRSRQLKLDSPRQLPEEVTSEPSQEREGPGPGGHRSDPGRQESVRGLRALGSREGVQKGA